MPLILGACSFKQGALLLHIVQRVFLVGFGYSPTFVIHF